MEVEAGSGSGGPSIARSADERTPAGRVNASLTISVLASLTKGSRPVTGPSRRAAVALWISVSNVLIRKQFPARGRQARGSAQAGTRGKARCRAVANHRSFILLGALALLAAFAFATARACRAERRRFRFSAASRARRRSAQPAALPAHAVQDDTSRGLPRCRTSAISRRPAPAPPASTPPVRSAKAKGKPRRQASTARGRRQRHAAGNRQRRSAAAGAGEAVAGATIVIPQIAQPEPNPLLPDPVARPHAARRDRACRWRSSPRRLPVGPFRYDRRAAAAPLGAAGAFGRSIRSASRSAASCSARRSS